MKKVSFSIVEIQTAREELGYSNSDVEWVAKKTLTVRGGDSDLSLIL